MDSKRLNSIQSRDLYVLEDESNPKTSKVDQILPSTILDQVYDDQDPTEKNLRTILEELRQDILTGGKGNIVFPVTSVNGKDGDVVLTKVDLGLGRIDNTADVDKPLSTPQRTAIMEILAAYDFNVSLDDLYEHILDHDNPHQVTIEQLNTDSELETYVETIVGKHNVSTTSHKDIRNSLSTLWTLVDGINNSLEDRLHNILAALEDHMYDDLAHEEVFNLKEDIANKSVSFGNEDHINHAMYPTTQSVVEYVTRCIADYDDSVTKVTDWIDDIQVVDTRSQLPTASADTYRKAYFIRYGETSYNEIAICRYNTSNGTYSWDYSYMGTYSTFNPDHFTDSTDGLSLNLKSITEQILQDNGPLDATLDERLADYYTSEDIDEMHLVNAITILPGTQDGTIRYYINDDMTTMSTDVAIPGLHRCAYLEWITENELKDNAVRSKHIIDNAIESRHLQDGSVTLAKFGCCTYGTVLGNTSYEDEVVTHEITLVSLADYLRPLIGGWPDVNTPGGNPWYEALCDQIPHVHKQTPGVEYDLTDGSYIMRFTGTISVLPNYRHYKPLSTDLTIDTCRMIDAGGTWVYQSDPEELTVLGGSNITGHTFGTIIQTADGLQFESISIGDRYNAAYDLWVKYVKTDESDSTSTSSGSTSSGDTSDDSYETIVDTTTAYGENSELLNWVYELDSTNKVITLMTYSGGSTDEINVYSGYDIDGYGDIYTTKIGSSSIFRGNSDIVSSLKRVAFYDGVVFATEGSMAFLFASMNLVSITFGKVDTSACTTMYGTFYNNPKLVRIYGLEYFNTGNVTTMGYMFSGCTALAEIDVSAFNTSNVTYTGWMFNYCQKITDLDLTNFDTSKVIGMDDMFRGCTALLSVDLSSFNTSLVETMFEMFRACIVIPTLDLRSFNTSNVTDMTYMFGNCAALEQVLVTSGKWDTSNVENTTAIFSNCPIDSVTYA